jgi:ApbE superfamily uncharacterized protein (UPF0280 family)
VNAPTVQRRIYRDNLFPKDLIPFQVAVKETDLWIGAENALEKDARDLVLDCRFQLENYIKAHPQFETTLVPYPHDPLAPPLVRKMICATGKVGVGPMAAVAGTIAETVAKGLLQHTNQVIVENGGDIYLKVDRPVTVSIFAGDSPLSDKLGVRISEKHMPSAVCSSSGSVGHSLSKGIADVITVFSSSASLADGAATALGNRVKEKRHVDTIARWADKMEGIRGGVAIVENKIALWGEIEVVEI